MRNYIVKLQSGHMVCVGVMRLTCVRGTLKPKSVASDCEKKSNLTLAKGLRFLTCKMLNGLASSTPSSPFKNLVSVIRSQLFARSPRFQDAISLLSPARLSTAKIYDRARSRGTAVSLNIIDRILNSFKSKMRGFD